MPLTSSAHVARLEHVMGMPIPIEARGDGAHDAVDVAYARLRRADELFSTYKPDSEISRINDGRLLLVDAHPDVREVITRCLALRAETDGRFDAWAPLRDRGHVDPSGLVKGWAVDRAARALESAGLRDFAINAGGDIRLRGGPGDGEPWRTGIQHPLDRGAVAAVIASDDLAIATSGAYERGEHIVDPLTGAPARGLLSVTVVGPDLATADAYATAAYAMGPDGPEWTLGLEGYGAMAITEERVVLSTPLFDSYRA